MNPAGLIDEWTAYVKEVRRTGAETLDGRETTVYSGTLSARILTESDLDLAGSLDVENPEELLKDLGDIPFTVNVDDAAGYVVRIRLDVREAAKTLAKRIVQRELGTYADFLPIDVNAETGWIECVVSQIGTVPEIAIPDGIPR